MLSLQPFLEMEGIELTPALYLIPSALAPGDVTRYLPPYNLQVMRGIRHYVVENVRTARRFLKAAVPEIEIGELEFVTLDEHTPAEDVPAMLAPLERGEPIGVISEAGCPAVADPGADLVAIAQQRGLKVVPLVGPSSILLGLMASGFNGQSFTFNGYLPIVSRERMAKMHQMARLIASQSQTQIFIETPYRTKRLISELCEALDGTLKLCVAYDLTGPGESVITRSLSWWKRQSPDYGKVPAIFLLYR